MKALALSLSLCLLIAGTSAAQISVGPADNTIGTGGNYTFFADGLVFDAGSAFTLNSVDVYPNAAGTVVVNLYDNLGTLLATSSLAVAGPGVVTVPLGFAVPVGTGLSLDAQGTTTGGLYRNNSGAVYPYSVPGIVDITGAINGLAAFYYFFYNWDVSGTPPPAEWETNDAESSFDFDGAVVPNIFGGAGATSSKCTTESTTVNIASTNVGLPWDIMVNVGQTNQPASVTGVVTPNGQIVNELFTPTTVFLNNLNLTTPFLGSFSAVIPAPAFAPVTSAQMFNFSPTNPDGVALSQACQLDVQSTTPPIFPVAGPTGDDTNVVLDYTCPTVPFYGQLYSQMFVHSNGFVSFGAAVTGTAGFSATVADALASAPVAAVWSDYSPNIAGTVSITEPAPGLVQVDWAGVPYFGEATGPFNTFSITVDTTSGVIVLDGLGGLAPNPISGGTPGTGDSMFLGLSLGNLGGTDAGPTDFTLLSGAPTANTDLIYEAVNLAGNLPNAVMNGITQITFTPAGSSYIWTSL